MILITGSSGLLGHSLKQLFIKDKIKSVKFLDSTICDLRDIQNVDDLFYEYQPSCIIHLAAKVGGVYE